MMASYQWLNRTVLGVAIKGDGQDLPLLNALAPGFGCPMTVCTNRWDAPELKLVTNVKLPGGNVHLELAGASGQFASLFHGDVSPDYYANVVHACLLHKAKHGTIRMFSRNDRKDRN